MSVPSAAAQAPQQQKTEVINGKKKIVPVMIRPFSNEQTINPFLNPFQNQMLRDTSTVAPPQPNLHLSTLEKDL